MQPERIIKVHRCIRLLPLTALLLTTAPYLAATAAAPRPGFTFPASSTWLPGDLLHVLWRSSSTGASARLSLYGLFTTVSALKRHPHTHLETVTSALRPSHKRGQVRLAIHLPHTARTGYSDLRP